MAFQFSMERPCDATISNKNTSAETVELWFSDRDCFALVCGKNNGWGKSSQDLFLIMRGMSAYGKIIWRARKLTDEGMKAANDLNNKLSEEIDRQYNEWRMNRMIEDSLCQTSNLVPT